MHNYIWKNRSGEIRLDVVFVVLSDIVWLTILVIIAFGAYKMIKMHQSDAQENSQTSIVSIYSEDNNSAPANNIFCSSCGKQVEKDYNNCPYCGESLIKAKDEVKTSVVVIYPENDNNVSDSQKANK